MTGPDRRPINRRAVLGAGVGLGVAGIVAAAGCAPDRPEAPRAPAVPSTAPPAPITSESAPPTSHSPAPTGPAIQVARADTGRPQVALTFHGAGELSITRQVLDILARHGAQATVLAVGTWLATNPDAAKMVTDGGHDLGNHTWDHPALYEYGPAPMLREITRCRDKLVDLTGSPGAYFRQSQGQRATQTELSEAGKAGYHTVLSYDVDSLDWRNPGPSVIRRAVRKARAGSIVSMHLGHTGTVHALPGILSDLHERGLAAVTATELLR